MKFVDYRSLAGHYSYMLVNDEHDSDVIYVNSLLDQIDSFLLRFLYKVHFSKINRLFNLPFKQIWYKYIVPLSIRHYKEKICFILQPSIIIDYGYSLINFLHANYSCKVVIVLGDRMGIYPHSFNVERLKKMADLVCTYNSRDAEKYQLRLHPSMVYNIKVDDRILFANRGIDVLFVGQEKGRGKEISEIFRKCQNLGLKCDFTLVGYNHPQKIDGINYARWLPYEDIINKIKNSKCILNILQPGAEGITLRDTEAYNFGCFLLTNSHVQDLDCIFNDGQVISLESLNQRTASLIQEKGFEFPRKQNSYSMDRFYDWIADISTRND